MMQWFVTATGSAGDIELYDSEVGPDVKQELLYSSTTTFKKSYCRLVLSKWTMYHGHPRLIHHHSDQCYISSS